MYGENNWRFDEEVHGYKLYVFVYLRQGILRVHILCVDVFFRTLTQWIQMDKEENTLITAVFPMRVQAEQHCIYHVYKSVLNERI